MKPKVACPLVYADGKHCTGAIYRAVAFGRSPDGSVQKWKLHCSKGNHAGATHSNERMEFYADQLPIDEVKLEAAGVIEG